MISLIRTTEPALLVELLKDELLKNYTVKMGLYEEGYYWLRIDKAYKPVMHIDIEPMDAKEKHTDLEACYESAVTVETLKELGDLMTKIKNLLSWK